MGLLDRLLRRHRDEPPEDAPGLFTARSSTLPATLERPLPRHERQPEAGPPAAEPDVAPPTGDHIEAPPAPAEADAWDDALWDDAPADTAETEAEAEVEVEVEAEPALTPEAALFRRPADHEDVDTLDEDGRRVRVHDGRLDARPGPIRMSPSEALRLAEEGPRALRRRSTSGPEDEA